MKKTILYLLIAVIVTAGVFLSGCELGKSKVPPVSIAERITSFTDALNLEDRSNLYTNFHTETENRQQIASNSVIESGPLAYANQPFAIAITDQTSPDADGKVTVTATFVNANISSSDPASLTLIMQEVEERVWYIREFTLWIDADDDDTVDTDEQYVIRRLY